MRFPQNAIMSLPTVQEAARELRHALRGANVAGGDPALNAAIEEFSVALMRLTMTVRLRTKTTERVCASADATGTPAPRLKIPKPSTEASDKS